MTNDKSSMTNFQSFQSLMPFSKQGCAKKSEMRPRAPSGFSWLQTPQPSHWDEKKMRDER
jgi:hypothetical protein